MGVEMTNNLRITIKAAELQAKIQCEVDKNVQVLEDEAVIHIPLPNKQETDHDGCNWNILMIPNPTGYLSEFHIIVGKLKALYNL